MGAGLVDLGQQLSVSVMEFAASLSSDSALPSVLSTSSKLFADVRSFSVPLTASRSPCTDDFFDDARSFADASSASKSDFTFDT
jgi:hypothetical protein